jgi:hypothetical protein
LEELIAFVFRNEDVITQKPSTVNVVIELSLCEISGSHGGEYEVQGLLGYAAV